MTLAAFDRWLANNLPGDFLRDLYPRALRRLTEYGLLRGNYIHESRFGFRMHVDRLDALKWCVHYFGIWEPGISAAITAALPRDGIFVDIGGNVGYTALVAAAAVGPAGKVHTFEPCARTIAELEANVALNPRLNITVHRCAVSDEAGSARLYTMADNELAQASFIEKSGACGSEMVETVSFDEIAGMVDLSTVDAIKIDVEGAEASVIRSLRRHAGSLKASCAIFIETTPHDDPRELLSAFPGFAVREIENRYDTRFYREGPTYGVRPFSADRQLADIVLCRDERVIARIERAMHQSRAFPLPASFASRSALAVARA
jgi:FkbM family methyltransferase